jgi:DNA-binding NarL/FixJ family response regulator
MNALKVLLADDHVLVRAGIRSLLESIAGVRIVAEVGDGHEALQLLRERKPDVAFLDLSMPGLNGLEVTAQATKEGLPTRILILSVHGDDEFICRAIRLGAAGYLLKNSDRSELELAVRAIARGEAWLSPAVSRKAMATHGTVAAAKQSSNPLTSRQREVLQLIAEGLSTKEIAHRLGLSVKTVESHRAQIMERLGIHGVAGLVRFALRSGIVQDD